MAITDLIARGGAGFDPTSYVKGYGMVEDIRNAQQNRRIQQQEMDLKRQKYVSEQQKVQLARGQEYATAIAPILKDIQDLPVEQRQQAYSENLGTFKQIASTHGMDVNQISPQYDDAKAKSIVTQFFKPTETREIKVGEKIITQELDPVTKSWKDISEAPRSVKQVSEVYTGAIEPTTKVTGEAQIGMVDTSTMLDNIFELKKRVAQAPEQLTVWGKAGGGLLKLGERLSVPLPEGGQEYLQTRQGIANYANKVYTTYRRMITGSQASKFELNELRSQAPTLDDSETTMNQKIKDWFDDVERLRVRYRKIIDDGFTPAGKDKEGNVYFTKGGKKVEISKIKSISDIPSAHERASQIEDDLLKNNPDINDQALIDLTLQALDREGYDTRRWK